ncbi:MAG: GNAT family N-acetyltransferase, partial [Pseudonocardiaceae bacterium]
MLVYAGTGCPVAYLVALPLTGYPDVLAVGQRLGVYPPDTSYLAELGVSPATRRQGLANTLLARLIGQRPASA